jgi:hypothetical protein
LTIAQRDLGEQTDPLAGLNRAVDNPSKKKTKRATMTKKRSTKRKKIAT